MAKIENPLIRPVKGELLDRVISILEQARANVVRSVNSNMVIAYWLIGREIVLEIQGGDERAEYGKKIIRDLSTQLNEKFEKGFSTTNLWYFRQFYTAFSNREPAILHKPCGELESTENPTCLVEFWETSHWLSKKKSPFRVSPLL